MDIFTSNDKRLVPPAGIAAAIPDNGPREYSVDASTFPQLHKAFTELQDKAGISGYRVVILGDNFGGAGVSIERKLIGIGIRKINSMPFEAIIGIIGHELGHVFLHDNPATAPIGEPIDGLNSDQMEEVQSDRFAACLMGGKSETLKALSIGVSYDPELPLNLRRDAVDSFDLLTCPKIASRSDRAP